MSPSCTGAGSAPITSLLSITTLTFTGDKLQPNYTPEGGDVLPKLGAFEATRLMSSSRCPVPVPPRPPRIRVSSHDAAVTAAAEEALGERGETKRSGSGRRQRGEKEVLPRPLLLAISSLRSGFYSDERGAEEQLAHPSPEVGLTG